MTSINLIQLTSDSKAKYNYRNYCKLAGTPVNCKVRLTYICDCRMWGVPHRQEFFA